MQSDLITVSVYQKCQVLFRMSTYSLICSIIERVKILPAGNTYALCGVQDWSMDASVTLLNVAVQNV